MRWWRAGTLVFLRSNLCVLVRTFDYWLTRPLLDGGSRLWRVSELASLAEPATAAGMNTSDDPVASCVQTFEELRTRKRWSTQSVTSRFVALSVRAAASTIGYDRLEEAATELRRRARWSSPRKSEIRYIVAAMILRRGLDPARIHECVLATRDGFKAHRVPSRGTGPTLALLMALHASRDVPVDALAADVEWAYTRLRDAGLHPRPAAPARLAAFGRRPARNRRRGGPVLRRCSSAEEPGGTGRTEPLRRGGAAGADPGSGGGRGGRRLGRPLTKPPPRGATED